MGKQETVICVNCAADNQLNQRTCRNCGQSLAASRTSYYLDRTDDDITNGRYDHARSNLTKADVEMLALSSEQRKCNLLTSRAFWLQSQIYYYKGLINEAHAELLLALQNLEGQVGGDALFANVLNSLGNVEFYHNNRDAAAVYYQHSSEVALLSGKHAIAAKAMGNLGIIFEDTGRMAEALACYTRVLEQAELSSEPLRLAEAYRLLAGLYGHEGPYNLALDYAAKALALRGQIADQASVCRISSEAGEVYLNYRDLDQAEICLNEAHELTQRTGYKLMQVTNFIALAELMRLKDNRVFWFDYASRAFNQVGSALSERATAALQLVMYYIGEQNWIYARKYMQALEDVVSDSSPYIEHLHLYRAQALLHAAMCRWDEAEQCFTTGIDLSRTARDPLRLASLQEEYAAMLLQRAAAEPDSDLYPRANAILEQVAASFRSLEMPLRLATIEAKLQAIPASAIPIRQADNMFS